jgi:rhamnogalacturonyl hydrolase YesR
MKDGGSLSFGGLGVWVLGFFIAAGLPVSSRGAAPATRASETRFNVPDYPVSYAPPTVQRIEQTLDRVRQHLEEETGYTIVDSKTHEPAKDLSRPSDVKLDSGRAGEFGPYSYPMGVIYNGMLVCGQVTGDKRYDDFVSKRFQMFADDLPALSSWPKEDLRQNPFRKLLDPGSLDDCGAMGSSMIRARMLKVGPDLKSVIDRFADYVSNKQFRLPDGTLARNRPFPDSLWLDDAYMGTSLLSQMGKMTGQRKYLDDAAKQLKQFHHYLFVPETKLFTHGGVPATLAAQPRYYWGRANGWYFVALADLLEVLPADHPDRAELIDIFKTHAQGIATVQSGLGLWHQMLDRSDSYLETSCSAMFAYGMAKGVNHGWLNPSQYGPAAQAGWNGVVSRIGSDGHIDGTCIGTSYAADYIYYYHRPQRDDVHGYGPTLLAGAEMIRMLQNDHLRIDHSPTKPTMYLENQTGRSE